MKKRLLIATDSFLPRWDGVSRFLSEILPFLTKKFLVTLVAPKFDGTVPKTKGVDIITIPTYRFRIGDYAPPRFDTKKIDELVKQADLVWTHTIGPIGGNALRLAKKHRVKVVSYVHSLEWELIPRSLPPTPVLRLSSTFLMREIARNLYNRADLLMVSSAEVLKILNSQGITPKKVLAPMGVSVNKFAPPTSRREARQRLGIVPDYFVIGFCGRVAREKDLPTLYKAFLKVNKKYPHTMLLIVGGGLKSLNRKFSHKMARFVGSTDNVLPYLQAMDVYVLPSLTETSSLSTMEAMACGLPVVVTPVGSIKVYVKEGYNGFFFSKGDSETLAKRIIELLVDPQLRKEMGKYARDTIAKHYRWDKTAATITRILSNF